MSSAKRSDKRRRMDPESLGSEKKKQKQVEEDDLDVDPDLSSDIKGIMTALQNIKEKMKKEEQQKIEEIIPSVESEIQSMIDDVKPKIEKERLKVLMKKNRVVVTFDGKYLP